MYKANFKILIAGVLLGGLIVFLFFRSRQDVPKNEISHTMIVEKIESLGNLEVLKYSIQDIVEYKKVRQWLPNAKTALIISGEVICCVDLTKLTPEDIYTAPDSIRLQLPAPEICHVKVDHSKSRIYNMEYGLWESEKVIDEAYRHAEKQLYEEAEKLDMEGKSRDNAVNLLRPILEAMGFKHVLITFKGKDVKG